MNDEVCGNCRFWFSPPDGMTVCRRFPPQASVVMVVKAGALGRPTQIPTPLSTFPPVGEAESCGEFTTTARSIVQ